MPLMVASESSALSVGLQCGIYSRLCYAFVYFELGWVHFPGSGLCLFLKRVLMDFLKNASASLFCGWKGSTDVK